MNLDILEQLLRPPAWHADAACKEHPEISFFPAPGRTAEAQQARQVCAGCLVRTECFEAADEHGIWGGTSARERRDARTAMRLIRTTETGTATATDPAPDPIEQTEDCHP